MAGWFVQQDRMKYKIFFLITVAILVFMGVAPASQKSSVEPVVPADPARTIRIQIEGLRESRVPLADHALRSVPGVLKVEFRTADKEAVVTIDVEHTNLKRLDHSLRDAGFAPWIH